MSAPTPPPVRAVKCLVRKSAIDDPGPCYGLVHVCSEPLHHEGEHACAGVIGCGHRWPRAT